MKYMKKFWLAYLLTVSLSIFLALILGWIFYPVLVRNSKSFVSPVPKALTIYSNGQVSTLDIWQPIKNFLLSKFDAPDLSAKNALSYDLSTEKMLFTKSPNQRVPFASLTKIMTAIIALEHPKYDDKYIVSSGDLVGEDSMGLTDGEIISLKDLLYGLILHSGNDAAETIASNFDGGRTEFIKAMNEKAMALGLTDTHFTNPTGLEGDGNQYTTAYDLLVITRFALANFPVFEEVASTFDYTIPQTPTHKEFYLENETNLLTSYPGVKGVKTGYTPEAGLCLVTYLEYRDHKILAVILGSDNRRDEMKQVLDFSLKSEGIIPPQHG